LLTGIGRNDDSKSFPYFETLGAASTRDLSIERSSVYVPDNVDIYSWLCRIASYDLRDSLALSIVYCLGSVLLAFKMSVPCS
jgi:hypothetical protein